MYFAYQSFPIHCSVCLFLKADPLNFVHHGYIVCDLLNRCEYPGHVSRRKSIMYFTVSVYVIRFIKHQTTLFYSNGRNAIWWICEKTNICEESKISNKATSS